VILRKKYINEKIVQVGGTSSVDSLNFNARKCNRENWWIFKVFCHQLPVPPSKVCPHLNGSVMLAYSGGIGVDGKQHLAYYLYRYIPKELYSYEESTMVIRSNQFKSNVVTIDEYGYVILAPENTGLVNQTWKFVTM